MFYIEVYAHTHTRQYRIFFQEQNTEFKYTSSNRGKLTCDSKLYIKEKQEKSYFIFTAALLSTAFPLLFTVR